MPVRPSAGKKAPEAKAPAKNAKKEVPSPAIAPEAEAGVEKLTKKSPLITKCQTFLKNINPELVDHVYDVAERQITDTVSQEKANVAFFQFSQDPSVDDFDDAYNVATIKDVLFGYHTKDDEEKGKTSYLLLDVLKPEDASGKHVLCIQEVSGL